MEEIQVLFRVPKDTMDALDEAISAHGFKTRNEWFRAEIREFLNREERLGRLRELLEGSTLDGITDEEITDMVRSWRAKKRERAGQ